MEKENVLHEKVFNTDLRLLRTIVSLCFFAFQVLMLLGYQVDKTFLIMVKLFKNINSLDELK
jgi:hypothetical protein